MRCTSLVLSLALGVGAVGCTADTGDVDSESANVSAKSVDWQPWDEPMAIGLDEPIEAELAHGQCEETSSSVEEKDGVTEINIEYDCGPPWGEVGWFVLSPEVLAQAEGDELVVTFQTEDVIRAQILSEGSDGATSKLALEHRLENGGAIRAPLYDDHAYHLQVARGDESKLMWAAGSTRFTLVVTTGWAEIASDES